MVALPRKVTTEREFNRGLIKSAAGASENVADFVADQFFHARAGGTEVFARVEFLWVLKHALADGGGHGEAQIGVNVDFGATDAAGDFNIGLRHAGGVFTQSCRRIC